ncbi:hypothetical protein NDI37_01570 [Funiculus sociatus GB2-A5]|uniref:Uncharacterized protein n=1 Tax=Funiculus sociatus GB2-A5 TaxID=2933946 RepID=A0ABV0JI84_9CYAN|nr:hypothetical protein [Trichocoleus sp. FACHB-6]MBD1922543.1 hypothetical protein [Microcoleus sp. FACHB-831]MBD2065679.1 hypothetical protein [Trichocoleus sp. FACHB-6]
MRDSCFILHWQHSLGTHEMCPSCDHAISEAEKTSPHYQEDISCPYGCDRLTPEKPVR